MRTSAGSGASPKAGNPGFRAGLLLGWSRSNCRVRPGRGTHVGGTTVSDRIPPERSGGWHGARGGGSRGPTRTAAARREELRTLPDPGDPGDPTEGKEQQMPQKEPSGSGNKGMGGAPPPPPGPRNPPPPSGNPKPPTDPPKG
ncbi:hypothetical protein GCM10009759_67710 [Kitasatospora saccharophila]|uniref:Uncharacterized protein n=1 Tax=Kitasatospora saccharophila TaxID=407973 RepID=A0ABP5JL80_9ACTN